MKIKLPIADCRLPVGKRKSEGRVFPIENRKSKIINGFTLIELLVVIAIMGTLAAMLLAVVSRVKRTQYIFNTRAELEQLTTAIERYKAAYGFYPPSNATNTIHNPLYYELVGVTYDPTNNVYVTLDGQTSITPGTLANTIGVAGIMNCTKGSGEDASAARDFLPDLKPKQWSTITNSSGSPAYTNFVLVASVGGPDATYLAPGVGVPDLNPWRYNSANPTNNPGAYDLYVQLVIGGKTNLVCNWTKQVQINTPYP